MVRIGCFENLRQGQYTNNDAQTESHEKTQVNLFGKTTKVTFAEQTKRREIKRFQRINQALINTSNKGNGSSRYTGDYVGRTHGETFEEDEEIFHDKKSHFQHQAAWIFQTVLDAYEESDCLLAINKAVVIAQC